MGGGEVRKCVVRLCPIGMPWDFWVVVSKIFYVHPGEMIQFDEYFSNGVGVLIAGLIKGNQWAFISPDHKAGHF